MTSAKVRSLLTTGVLTAASLLGSATAGATPREGEPAPNATIEDADGHVSELKAFRGKPILIVYEDRASATQNQALKDELAKLARGDGYRARLALAAVADVSAYNFWPAKGFVKDAIRDESRQQGTTIYCDWTGAFRSAYRLRRGVSSVVLVGKDGRVLFVAEGSVSAEQRRRLVSMLREQIDAG